MNFIPLYKEARSYGVLDSTWYRRLRKRLRRAIRLSSSVFKVVHFAPGSFVATLVVLLIFLFCCSRTAHRSWSKRVFFDDVEDMEKISEMDRRRLAEWRNQSAFQFRDSTFGFNMTEVKMSRVQWDYIFGEISRRPVPPVLTKYKKRILRELFQSAKYVQSTKLKANLHVSCNYLNDIEDNSGPSSFQCESTSHRCADGSYEKTMGFSPIEGTWVTWENVVLVLMISADRISFLEAAADTWIARLDPSATIFIARDKGSPELPRSLKARDNVVVYDYAGPEGIDQLDIKAILTWNEVHKYFAQTSKRYFVKMDDDTFIVGHSLIRFLMKIDHWFGREEAIYFGHPFCGHGDLEALGYGDWCYAGGGAYGFNAEALGMLVRQVKGGCAYFYDYVAKAADFRPRSDKYGGRYEDVMVGRCLRQAKNRYQRNGTSLLACGSFFPYAPLHYYENFGHSIDAMVSKLGKNIITLHNLEPSAMRYMDKFLFELPIGGTVTPFSKENPRLENELLKVCYLKDKKMVCGESPEISFKRTSGQYVK